MTCKTNSRKIHEKKKCWWFVISSILFRCHDEAKLTVNETRMTVIAFCSSFSFSSSPSASSLQWSYIAVLFLCHFFIRLIILMKRMFRRWNEFSLVFSFFSLYLLCSVKTPRREKGRRCRFVCVSFLRFVEDDDKKNGCWFSCIDICKGNPRS